MDPMLGPLQRSAAAWVAAFWIMMALCFLSVLSLACSLFSFGIVLELQPGWTVWGVFYSYMVAFPLLGVGILIYFMMIYVKKSENSSKAGLLIISIPYILIVTAIVAYLIFDVIVNCNQNNDAYCWNGLSIRWQYWWMFFSIIFQWIFIILQIIFTNQVVNAYQILYAFQLANTPSEREPLRPAPTSATESVTKQQQRTIQFGNVQNMFPNNIGLMLLSEVHDKKV